MMDPQQQQLRTWFDAIDTNRSGELDASELQQALRLGNLHFGLTDVVGCLWLAGWLVGCHTRQYACRLHARLSSGCYTCATRTWSRPHLLLSNNKRTRKPHPSETQHKRRTK